LKRLFPFFLLFVSVFANATDYYASPSGNDGNTGTQASPFRTATKAVSVAVSGDRIFLQAAGEYFGSISPASGVTFNSYGAGAKPIISGFTTLGAWTSIGGGLYEQVVSAAQSTMNMVLRNNVFQSIGRYPNLGDNTGGRQNGYNIVGSVATGSIGTNQALPNGVSFVGGEVVIRAVHWILDRHPVTSNSTTSISFSGGGYTPTSGFGYFLQNVPNATTLDVVGEWAYTPSSKKITMFFGGGGPGATVVKVATAQNLVTLSSKSNISFTNIQFVGSNQHILSITGCSGISLTDCEIIDAGVDGINSNSATSGTTLLRTNFTRSNNNHIRSNNASNWNITFCNLLDNGMVAGMGGSGDGTYFGTSDLGNNSLFQFNTLTNSGYAGVNYNGSGASGNNTRVLNNLILNFCSIKDDGAGIYTGDVSGYNAHTQCRIENNIVGNGIGAGAGAGGTSIFGQTSGIYMDDYSINTIINGNTVFNCFASGIYLHLAKDLTVTNNTTFGNGNQELRIVAERANGVIRNINMSGNIWFNMTADNVQNFFVMVIRANWDAGGGERVTTAWGTWNNNWYCRPINNDNQSIIVIQPSPSFVGTLPQWQSLSGKDANSKATPTPISTNPANYRLEYNASNVAVVRPLGGNYKDVRGTVYAGSITLQPWTSAVLIATGATNSLPIVSAGADQTITLPTSQVSVTGTATDPDGTIASRQWTKLIGTGGTITSPTAATTTITGLQAGGYQFQFCATDNSGGSACDVMSVTVNPAPLVPPVSNAGPDRTIQLPVTTTTLNGSGSDADGTVTGYLWTKVSGPAVGTIVSSTQPVTNITGLTSAGTYVYNLRVTDNAGLTANDQVTVTVLPVANTPPTVTASANQTITLPTSSVTVTATASDPGGSIASYLWTKVSGPAGGTITNAAAASTTITGYTNAGTYVYQILVTDNGGLTATATTQITVQAAIPPNQPPVANAGADRTITLPTSSLTQVGSATDADGTVTGYLWTKISGTGGAITTPTNSTTSFTGLSAGTYIYQLRATDNLGATGTDQFTITVNVQPNTPPIANAGPDQVKTLPGQTTATMAGSATDPGGSIVSTVWSQIGGTASTITNANSLTTTITGLTTAGSRTYRLLVTDNLGATDDDTMIILVNPAPNVPPVSNAGSDKVIVLPTNSVTQVGSGTDADGTIVAYLWTKVSGPTGGTIVSATQATTVINALNNVGVYTYNLRVTDNSGATANDQMTITVNAANTPPIVSAGANQSITLPTSSVTLTGTASDPGGSIASYQWTKISGPASGTITTPTSATTTVTGYSIAGTYVYQLFVTDNGGLTASSTTQVAVIAANIPPTANAGANQTITLPTSSVTLTGSGSDPDGTIVGYAWAKISGPASGTITSPSTASTTVTGYSIAGTYVYRLTVTDNGGLTGSSTTQIIVQAAIPPNLPPVVNAGTDKVLTLPTNSVNQVGSATDPDGTISSYVWTKVSGPATFTINSPTSATTLLSGLVQGTYIFQLQATDNLGSTGTDQATIQVDPIPNVPPTANAGSDQSITLPTSATTLIGTGTDPDGTIVSYTWTKISGPSGGTIATPNQSTTNITSLIQGTYIYQLTVTDNSAATGTDQVTVIVNAAPLIPPVANAGPDQTIQLPTTTTTLAGSGTDPDGTIVSHVWNFLSGPATPTITTPTSYTSGVTGLSAAGSYYLKLSVNDNDGQTDTDTMIILVNLAPNLPPISNAGPSQALTTPIAQTVLNGAASTDPDGTIVSWLWTRFSGPPQHNIVSATQPVTIVNNLTNGNYVFNLRVTDNRGGTSNDTVSISVDSLPSPPPPVWIPPVSNAGPDKHPIICLFCSTTSQVITGSGTSTYGSIVSYQWTKVSGPSGGNISSPNTAGTNITSLVRGTYVYRLTVTDNMGYTNTNDMTILVTKNHIVIRRGKIIIEDY
jgi:hypothetical protein